MNKIFKERLLVVLRSDKYKHHKSSRLRTKEGFSSLGVICDLFSKNGWYNHPNNREFYYTYYNNYYYAVPYNINIAIQISKTEHYNMTEMTILSFKDFANYLEEFI